MSREIKFRAWDGLRMTTTGIQFNNSTGELVFIPKGKLMQFTGLKDKNGVEIYEGDIIHLEAWGGGRHIIEWKIDKCGFNIPFPITGAVVIGNIHENPNLLESKDE